MTRSWRMDEDRSADGNEIAVLRFLEMAQEMDERAATYLAEARACEYEAQRAVERGNAAQASAVGARKQAQRHRRAAEALSRKNRERNE